MAQTMQFKMNQKNSCLQKADHIIEFKLAQVSTFSLELYSISHGPVCMIIYTSTYFYTDPKAEYQVLSSAKGQSFRGTRKQAKEGRQNAGNAAVLNGRNYLAFGAEFDAALICPSPIFHLYAYILT